MKKLNIPKELEKYLINKKITKVVKAHRSGDTVLRIGKEYILKISKDIKRLTKEKEINDLLKDNNYFPKTIKFIIQNDVAYYLRTNINGKPLVDVNFLKKPQLVIKLLKEAINIFHSINTNNINILNNESIGTTFIHGDFCLPNIIIKYNKVVGFIDINQAGLGDPWVDYAWAIWSLEYNLKTSGYTEAFLNELDVKFDEIKYNLYTKE